MDKEKIIEFMSQKEYVPMKAKELAYLFGISKDRYQDFIEELNNLESNLVIVKNRKNKYRLNNVKIYEGKYRKNSKGYGFVKVENFDEEIYISKENSLNALNEDNVLIEIIKEKDKGQSAEGKIVKIKKHKKNTIVGIFQKSQNFGFVVPDDKSFGTDIYISKKNWGKARSNHKVLVQITKYPEKGKNAEGKVIEVLGGINQAGVDMLSLIKEFALPYTFSEEVINEAKSKGEKVEIDKNENRIDLRNDEIFTIDGEDAKDLDDAVRVTKLENGNYKLDVHIADVSYYVTQDSLLDKEAYIRGTSIYMLGRVIPMLPRELSNGLCSLNANEDRFKYYLLRGNLHALQQQMSHAKNDYKKAIDHAKDAEEALPARYLYAGLCEGQGKLNEAIDEYLKISDYDEKNSVIFLKLAELYEKTEGLVSAIQILERGKKERNTDEFDEILAGYYIRNSQPQKAFEITKSDLTKARALFDMDKNEEGYELLMKNKTVFEKEKVFYSLLAQYYFQKNMFNEAFKAIDDFAKFDKNSPLIYQMRALIYEKQNDSFNEHINWGKYNILRGEKDVALNEYMTAYRFNDSDADLIETIAVLLETEGDKTKASEFYEKLLDVEPNNKTALQKLAEFRESIGDNRGAFDYIEKLKTIDPRNNFVKDNYETYKEKAENEGNFLSFFSKLLKCGKCND